MKKTIVTIVVELQDTYHEDVKMLMDVCFSAGLRPDETYQIVEIEDIEE